MKHTVIITATLATFLTFAACERVNPSRPQAEGEGFRLTLTCGDITTKTTQPGVGNENIINTADVFLFNGDDPEFKHHWRFSPEVDTYFTCFIQAAVIADGTYKVYVIVNYPGEETDFVISSTNATLAQLQALALSEDDHRTFTAAGITPAPNDDLSLVMTGLTENITVEAVAGQTLVGNAEIELTRLPAKVTMDFYLKDEVVNTKGNVTETWTPLADGNNIRVYLCNGASEALVGGEKADAAVFDYAPNLDNTAISGKTDYSTAFSSTAFYTYPESWTYGAADEPYLKLIVPWKLVRSSSGIIQESQKEFYYKVMLPTNAFASNNWYHLTLDVTQLGGNADDDAVNVPCGYQVVNWRTGSTISSSMSPGYYLDVNVPDIEHIEFYGNTLDIPYFASGTVQLISYKKEWEDYRTGVSQTENPTSAVSLSHDGDYIHIDNTLKYDFDKTDYDVSPYTYTIEIGIVGDSEGQYNKTLVVTQYPPLYITNLDTRNDNNSQPNVFINNTKNNQTNNNTNYNNYDAVKVWDNSNTTTSNNITKTYQPHYLGAAVRQLAAVPANSTVNDENQNPNIYSVTTTILKFTPTIDNVAFETVLGDPRAAATNEYSSVLNGGNSANGLTNYRPTAEDTENVISPKFISASSYGKTYAVSYEGARKRCAAYQEYGYPAGRWRLPTKAEILFLQKLNFDEKIPKLYGTSTTSGYWAAGHNLFVKDASNQDTFVVLDDNNANESSSSAVTYTVSGTTYSGYVRCVYDTWYWGDQHSSTTSGSWLGYKTGLNDTF